MADVEFKDFSIQVKEAIEEAVMQYLEEAGGEMVAQTVRRTPVDTGQLKNSWTYEVDSGNKKCTIGSPLENAIWTEFGTGEYALHGDGRKGGWYVPAEKLSAKAKTKMQLRVVKGKEFYFTRGKVPKRCLHNAFQANKAKLIKLAEQVLKEGMK